MGEDASPRGLYCCSRGVREEDAARPECVRAWREESGGERRVFCLALTRSTCETHTNKEKTTHCQHVERG